MSIDSDAACFHPGLTARALLGATVVAGLLAGCNRSGDPNRRPTSPVTVTVTYKGKPVAGATVTFISEDAEPSAAFGETNDQGVAKLKTYEEGDGAVLGKQKVTIIKEQIVNEKKAPDQDSPQYAPGETPPPQVKRLIPDKYTAPGTSPLTAEVTASGPNEFKFDLTD